MEEISLNEKDLILPGTSISLEQPQDYYKIKRMSNSAMKHFRQSPRHYLYYMNSPFEETPAMILGRAFHCYVLEPDEFENQFFLLDESKRPEPDKTMSSKLNQNWKYSLISRNAKKTLIKDEDLNLVKRMADALYNCPPARELLEVITEVEKPVFWKDPETGIEMKAKYDGISPDITIDLKTCVNAEPHVFGFHSYDMGYHRQGALYSDSRPIATDPTGKPLRLPKGDFYFIAVEKEPPYGVSVNKASRDFIIRGRLEYTEILENFRFWQDQGAPDVCYEWRTPFGYHSLKLPPWVK